MKTNQTHRLLGVLSKENSVLRFEMRDGDIFLLTNYYPLDFSIYEIEGKWSAQIVKMPSNPANKFHKVGNGLDFDEKDVDRILNEANGFVLYQRNN